MWNKALIACARTYPSGVLTVVEDSGYPRSVRCLVEFDDGRELILISIPSLEVVSRQGLACLLFHRHNADMSGQRELLIKGELHEEAGSLVLHPGDFLTGSGRQDTDRRPYAGSPMTTIRDMMLGRRKARETGSGNGGGRAASDRINGPDHCRRSNQSGCQVVH